MQRNRVVRAGQVALLVVVTVAGFFFYFMHAGATGHVSGSATPSGGLPTDAQTALDHAVDSLRLPGIQVPTTWQVSSAELAAHPDQLPARGAATMPPSVVWCVRIAPPIMTLATPRSPAIALDHFIIAHNGSDWVAYSVDGSQPLVAQNRYAALGCANG